MHAAVYTDQDTPMTASAPCGRTVKIRERVTLEVKAADALHRSSSIKNAAWSGTSTKLADNSFSDYGPMLVS